MIARFATTSASLLTMAGIAISEEVQLSLGGEVEAVFWGNDAPAGALLKQQGTSSFAPRFRLNAEALLSTHWYLHANGAVDRGFDAHDRPDGEFRLDEGFVRYRPLGDGRLNVQVGKFPTVFGSWVGQHDFHDDAFLLAPLPYSQIIGIGVLRPESVSPTAIMARANGDAPGILDTRKRSWGSTIWGPSYSTGAAVFGSTERFDYALDVKNAPLSSHPPNWKPHRDDFDNPVVSGRFGYRPNAAWAFGVSASRGPYLETSAEELLPEGTDRGDLPHTLVGLDARWAHRDWIFSGEVIGSQFETLESGDLRSLSWYAQARWKAAPGFWLAGRFGQTLNNEVRGDAWSPDLWRAELGTGWRVTPDLLFKTNYSYTSVEDGTGSEHIYGAGFGWRF